MAITVRPATDADREFCYTLHRAALGPYVTQVWGWDEDTQRAFHREHFTIDGGTAIVRVDGVDAGVLVVDRRPTETILGLVELLPEFQGRGVGTQLIRALAAEGRRVVLEVLVVNERAHALYHRLGFREVARNDRKITMAYMTDKRSWDTEGDRLAAEAIAAGDPTGWFDRLYAAGVDGEVDMPWDRTAPHPLVAEWAAGRDGTGCTAVVVGCGLGADAEFLAGLGFATTAFDIAPTAVRVARERNPGSTVDYRVADLLAPPAAWIHGFDLVVDVFTVQALPDPPRRDAIVNVGRLVAPGGSLVIVAFRGELPGPNPPWPLTREEVEAFATDGLDVTVVEETADVRSGYTPRWFAWFTRT